MEILHTGLCTNLWSDPKTVQYVAHKKTQRA